VARPSGRVFFCAPFCATELRHGQLEQCEDAFGAELLGRASHDCAVVLSAGSIARYRAAPQGWDGHLEEQLAIEALASEPNPTAAFGKTSREAAKLVTSMRSLAGGLAEADAPLVFWSLVAGLDVQGPTRDASMNRRSAPWRDCPLEETRQSGTRIPNNMASMSQA
jgi:hypothetical protein